jgi:RND family efflux transporter MFP subunit
MHQGGLGVKKWIFIVAAVLLLVMIGFKINHKIALDQALRHQNREQAGKTRSSVPMVRAISVQPEAIKQITKLVGTIAAVDELAVQPRTGGRLLSLPVKEGTVVRQGQLIAILDDEAIRIQMQQSEASLAGIRANVQQATLNAAKAQTDRDRYQELLKQRYIAAREYENINNAYQTAQASLASLNAQLQAAERNYDLLKLQLNQTKIYSPIDGVVTHKPVTVGTNLTTGSTIVKVADLNPVKLTFNVDQKDAPLFHPGVKVSFVTDAYYKQQFNGQIDEVAPTYDSATRTLTLTAQIQNPDRKLLPGMFGTAEILLGANQAALVVPAEAVVTREEQTGVFVVCNNIANFRPVRIGLRTEGAVEITSGITLGEQVVVLGQNRLRDGQPVQLIRRGGKDQKERRSRPDASSLPGNKGRQRRKDGGGQ